ncbi:DUF1800 family protein [Micromonospora olivasterospora]|uniref:Uncharacterized protein (DUF1800 family) n=1 Tax=Micromonospora olivasterospora TaxID=1880 RepID=A0A562ICG7_MICOL|nr:DUF1800 family protein [Micromonospora olivasterospora]TWH68691.1 uncharacterized protein (DUF1800 family) [Micromonospora olivasterospora]
MPDDIILLLRRAGFGPTAAEAGAARQLGYAAALSGVVAPAGPDVGATSAPVPDLGPDPFVRLARPTDAQRAEGDRRRTEQTVLLARWWLDRMTVADHQAVEKLVFFWHGHWATSVAKVRSPQLMLGQLRTFRESRDFAELAHRMVLDRALVYWLDGQHNKKAAPNENLARELFELFMLGVGQYSERDVKEAGRALTGWRVALDRETLISDPQHRDTGRKTILGTTTTFDARTLVDLLLRQPSCPRFIASRLWFRYASSTQPIPERTREAMAAAFPAPMAMLRALFEDEAFRATRGTMVKQPVEWLVGAMRNLGIRPAAMPEQVFTQIYWALEALGQRPFAPPSVGGWPAGATWLTSAAAQVRLKIASTLAGLLPPAPLTPEAVAHLLCVDRWTDRTYAALRDARDPRLTLTLGLSSPEYLVT